MNTIRKIEARIRALVLGAGLSLAGTLAAEQAPWDTPLERLTDMLTGSTIRIVGILLILSAGLYIAVSEGSNVKKRVAWIVIGLGVAINASVIIDKILT